VGRAIFAVPGPAICDQLVVSVLGFGYPSSVAPPVSAAVALVTV